MKVMTGVLRATLGGAALLAASATAFAGPGQWDNSAAARAHPMEARPQMSHPYAPQGHAPGFGGAYHREQPQGPARGGYAWSGYGQQHNAHPYVDQRDRRDDGRYADRGYPRYANGYDDRHDRRYDRGVRPGVAFGLGVGLGALGAYDRGSYDQGAYDQGGYDQSEYAPGYAYGGEGYDQSAAPPEEAYDDDADQAYAPSYGYGQAYAPQEGAYAAGDAAEDSDYSGQSYDSYQSTYSYGPRGYVYSSAPQVCGCGY